MAKGSKILIAYVPVPHSGYLNLFRVHWGATAYVLGDELVREHQSLVRHLPAVSPEQVCTMLNAVSAAKGSIRPLTKAEADYVRDHHETIVMPDEDIMHRIANTLFEWCEVEFDGSTRLRWDWGSSQEKRVPEGATSSLQMDRDFMQVALDEARKSPDWWRQVGAAFVRNSKVLIASYNQHLPHEQSAYLEGDPRSNFNPGEHIDLSLALHAEAGVIAEAARRGIAMEGGDLYVTTFPCPQCAYKIAASGIKHLYYQDGYTMLAGLEALQSRGVTIIRVA